MHLKNLALLKTAGAGAKAFTAVRFAPLYDAVTTRVFPGLGSDRMALKLNGKDDRLSAQDFLALARTIGLTAGGAEVEVADLAARLAARAVTLRLPDFADQSEAAKATQDKVIAIVRERSSVFTG